MLGKAVGALGELRSAIALSAVVPVPELPLVCRFESFREGHGVWLVRQPGLQFALPIVGSFAETPAISDYLPAPHGLKGFAVPVQQQVPALVPFLELSDGRTVAAVGRAQIIEVFNESRSLRIVWEQWHTLKGERVDLGLQTEVRWDLTALGLVREETLTVSRPLTIRRWRVWLPTTHDRVQDQRCFSSGGGALEISYAAHWPIQQTIRSTAHHREGRGALGPIPLILELEATGILLSPSQPVSWRMNLRVD
jgi:hypothetical protein